MNSISIVMKKLMYLPYGSIKKKLIAGPAKAISILFFLQIFYVSAFSQTQINGVVKDTKGDVISGVSVNLKGTTIGTITNLQGEYSINIPSKGVLVFTNVGYVTQEVNVTNETNINVILESVVTSLEEVTVVGYGTQKKTSLTSAVADIKGEDLNRRSVANAQQA